MDKGHPWMPLSVIDNQKRNNMDATKFKRQADTLIRGLEHLIRKMPQKGNAPTECQRTTLLTALNKLTHAVNGVTDADFIETNTNGN